MWPCVTLGALLLIYLYNQCLIALVELNYEQSHFQSPQALLIGLNRVYWKRTLTYQSLLISDVCKTIKVKNLYLGFI